MATLTIAGVAFCASLLGSLSPTWENCQTYLRRATPTCDYQQHCPAFQESSPNDHDPKLPEGFQCLALATYDMTGGGRGTTYWCTTPATLTWLPDGHWVWYLEGAK